MDLCQIIIQLSLIFSVILLHNVGETGNEVKTIFRLNRRSLQFKQ